MSEREALIEFGVLGLLARGKHRGLVDRIEPLLHQLQDDLGFRISESRRHGILRPGGE